MSRSKNLNGNVGLRAGDLGLECLSVICNKTDLFQEILPDIKIRTDSQFLLLGAPVSEASIEPAIEVNFIVYQEVPRSTTTGCTSNV